MLSVVGGELASLGAPRPLTRLTALTRKYGLVYGRAPLMPLNQE
jgi:hypothetical protein